MLEIKNVQKIFKNNKGIKDISFTIEKGDFIAFIGDNGAGKTTIIKCIFNEYAINQGQILLHGESIFANKNLQKIAFFPDLNSIPLEITFRKYLEYHANLANISKKKLDIKLSKINKELNIFDYLNKKIQELSAGWKKKAILTSILIRNVELIIFDEPTANLDIASKNELINLMKSLHQSGVTLMVTSHILEELQPLANKLILLKDGEIIYNNKFNPKKETILSIYKEYIHKSKELNKKEKIKNNDILEKMFG